MTKKTIKRGSGITARECLILDAKGMLQHLENWNKAAGKNNFEKRIATVEQWALSVLKVTGIEPTGEESGGADTPENYAQRFLNYIRFIRAFIERGDTAQAARCAVNLGILLGESGIKFEHEKDALLGKKFTAGRKPGAGGPIRKAIEKALKKNPRAKNAELWLMVSDRAPRGWSFLNNRTGMLAPVEF
jgi:hypothetical protein